MSGRRLTSFSEVPFWKETDAEGTTVQALFGVELSIEAFTTTPGKLDGEEYENVFIMAMNVEDNVHIKFRCASKVMLDQLREVPEDEFPVIAAIFEEGSGVNKYYTFK